MIHSLKLHCAALLTSLMPLTAQADPAGDAVLGAKLFLQCRACHTVGAAEPDGVGPNLGKVLGAPAASRGGYAYSPAMAASGLTWTTETLDRFLAKPSALVPGNKMAFLGVASPKSRQDLIAYLATLAGEQR